MLYYMFNILYFFVVLVTFIVVFLGANIDENTITTHKKSLPPKTLAEAFTI